MPPNHLILCRPLLHLPSIFPSIRVFSNESVLHIRWPKYWSFSFSISLSSEYSGLISLRMDWLAFLSVHRTLKSLLQYHSSKSSILWCSAFFIVQLSYPYMTTGKTIALARPTFVGSCRRLPPASSSSERWRHLCHGGRQVSVEFSGAAICLTQTGLSWTSGMALERSIPVRVGKPLSLRLALGNTAHQWSLAIF